MAPIRMPEAVIGLDVGKSSHWACVATRDGEVLLSTPVANREDDLDSLFGRFPDALVVVDQSRNIGALALARARAAGMSAAYLPGLAAHGAARLFAGDAKTDERDAMVIAKTALGIPDALLPVGDPGPTIAAARALAAQRNFLTCENTRNKNRLRSILLESCPAFEALVDLSDGSQLRLMASLGGAWSVADAGPRRAAALTRGAARGKIEALVRSTTSSTRPDASVVAAEDRAVKLLARKLGGDRGDHGGDLRPARGRRYLPMPPDGAGHRAQNRFRACDLHRHRRLPQSRQARVVLRPGAAQPPVGNLDLLGDGIAPRQQEAEEPAHILMQLPYSDRGEMGRLLHQVPRAGHVARQGAQGAGAKETEGHLRGHARQGALRSLAETHRAD